jgi:Domain of unknown function (DUF6484)
MTAPSSSRPAATPAAAAEEQPILAPRVGWVAGVGGDAGVLVDFPGNARGPLPARSTLVLDGKAVLEAVASRQGVVLLFENGDPSLPLLIGLVEPAGRTPLLDLILEEPAAEGSSSPAGAPAPAEATVDGSRVVFEGKDEIVLRCGESSITLRRNGKIVIRGAYVETHAAGTNRIKGGSVRIN